MTDQPTDLRDRIVAAMRRAPFEDLRPDWTAPNGPLKITARINDLADAVLAELRTVPAVPVSSPPPDQTALLIAATVRACAAHLRDRYSDTWTTDAARSLELNAARIERGEPTALLRRLAQRTSRPCTSSTSP